MPNAKDLEPDTTFYKVFATGDFGTGKSVFASTFPTPGYVFDFDKGIEIYAGGDWEYDQFELSPQGWVAFEKKFREVRERVKKGEFKTVVVDSTTTMTDCAMERALQLDPKRSATDGPLWNVHYNHVKNLMEPKLRGFTNWNCNLITIAHLQVVQDQETGAVLSVDPLLTGQLSQRVPGSQNVLQGSPYLAGNRHPPVFGRQGCSRTYEHQPKQSCAYRSSAKRNLGGHLRPAAQELGTRGRDPELHRQYRCSGSRCRCRISFPQKNGSFRS